jgi:RNA polymerase sigma-70 factor (ECF subfamily)
LTTSRDQIGRVDDTSSLRRLRVLVVEDDPDSRDLIVALLVRSVAAGNQGALLALYERAHRVVFTLIMRITVNHATAEEVTLDVFHDVWRRASCYHEADGTVLGWIMTRRAPARSTGCGSSSARSACPPRRPSTCPQRPRPLLRTWSRFSDRRQAVRAALEVLTPDERQAIEAAFFSELTYATVAERLNQPLGTIKTRIRSGLHKLREALTAEGHRL